MTNKYDYSFTIPEIRIALKTSRSNTAPGSDGLPTRVLQLCELEEDVLNVLNSHPILTNIYNTVHNKWKHSIIVSIPKKGNSSSHENQRGIAKSCAFAKLTNKLLLARICDIIEPQLLGVQSGFCTGRSTVEQTMDLCYILDMCRVSKHTTIIIFSTLIRLLIPLIDVLFQKYCQSMAYHSFSLQCNALLHRDFCSNGHGTQENAKQHLVFKVTHWHLSSSSPYLTTFFVKRF